MSEENQMPEGVAEFLRMFEDAKRQMAAVEVLSQIMQVTEDESSDATDQEQLDKVVNIPLAYGDRCVLEAMNKGPGL